MDWLGAQPNPSLDGGAKPNQTLELRRKKKEVPPRLTEEGRRGEKIQDQPNAIGLTEAKVGGEEENKKGKRGAPTPTKPLA